MIITAARALALATPLILLALPATAQDGFLGFGGDGRNPSLSIAPAEINLDVPMPVNSINLASMLAHEDRSLSSIKAAALREYRAYLDQALQKRLRAFFRDQEIPLVRREGLLSLHNRLDITVIKHLSALASENGYDVERGAVAVNGSFRYQLMDLTGRSLRERRLNVSEWDIRADYLVKTPQDGGAGENTTEQSIKLALSEMVEEVFEQIEDDLEADELRDLVSG